MSRVFYLLAGEWESDVVIERLSKLGIEVSLEQSTRSLPWQAQLCRLLGWLEQSGQQLPVLDPTRSASGDKIPAQESAAPVAASSTVPSATQSSCSNPERSAPYLVHADPVHFRVDRDTATLIPGDQLSLSRVETDALLETINEFLAADDLCIFLPDRYGSDCRLHEKDQHSHTQVRSVRWIMSGMTAPPLATYPTSFVAYRYASAFLPEGADRQWQQLATELQMLLHTHPLNTAREHRGQLPVNGIWFWGDSRYCPEVVKPEEATVFSDNAYAEHLCRCLGAGCHPLSDLNPDLALSTGNLPGDLIVHIERLPEPNGVSELWLEDHFKSLLQGSTRQTISECQILTEEGVRIICGPRKPWWKSLWNRK